MPGRVENLPENSSQRSQIIFSPSGKRANDADNKTVLQIARELGVDIDSICGGRGICGRCQIEVAEGQLAKYAIESSKANLSPISDAEQTYAERQGLKPNRRLSCQALVQGNVVIDVPADSQVHRQVIRKDHEAYDIELDPICHLYYVEVLEPVLENPDGDLQRLYQALDEQWGVKIAVCNMHVVQRLSKLLRGAKWKITVAIRENRRIVEIWPGFKGEIFGVAIDIGSTTIAAHLCDLTSGEVLAVSGNMNPQIRYGEDLMSRVSYCMKNPGGAEILTKIVRETVNKTILEAASSASIDVNDILEVTIVGNPIMHHLMMGLDPTQLGVAPFPLATDGSFTLPANMLDIQINPGGTVYVLPCVAGHVGADTAAVILAELPDIDKEYTLIVDVGTNAEIVLGNSERLVAASSPTGPAFEGAQISCGQRATYGAIERVRIDKDTLEPKFKVIGCDLWSTDPRFAEQTRGIGVSGICGSGIIEVLAEMYLAGIISQDGAINSNLAEKTNRIFQQGRTFTYLLHHGKTKLCIQQTDIRAIQLAKAALYAGAKLLMDILGIQHVDKIRLAGAFGAHIDVKYAMVLGLIPDCKLDKVASVGNAATTGARIALLNQSKRTVVEAQVKKVEKIETAVAEDFQKHFINALAIPNKIEAFPHMSKIVNLPDNTSETKPASKRRRRRKP